MNPDIASLLKNPSNPTVQALLDSNLKLLKRSKDYMFSKHAEWDAADASFRMDREPDEQDRKAERRKEPKKVTLPFAHSQILTWVAFCFLLYNQRENFYNLTGSGPEDNMAESDAQKVIAGDLKRSKFNAVLYQLLLDVGRWGVCIAKTSWVEKKAEVLTQRMAPAGTTLSGMPVAGDTSTEAEFKVVYEGTEVKAISPYHFFYDTNLPLSQFQDGEFAGSEELYSRVKLKKLEADGVVSGIDDLPFPPQDWVDRSRFKAAAGEPDESNRMRDQLTSREPHSIVISEIQRWVVPSEVKLEDGKTLGPETRPVLYLFWVANWARLVRAEPMNYPHSEFTYDVGQFNNDQHKRINEGLAELVQPMQDVATWLLNSRVASVRKIIDSRLIVNTQMIEEKDLISRSPIIRTKPTAMGALDQFVKQLTVSDTTQGHMSVDIPAIWGFVQSLTGTNENSMGQFSGGRRDATQSRAANAGAASRNKTVASVLWETLFEPMGQKVLMNAQGSMTLEEFQRRVGDDADEARFLAFNKRDKGVYNNYDFVVFDGTLPSEKGFIAQSMQELLLGLFENPQAQLLLQDPTFRKLLVKICELRQIPNPAGFLPPPVQPNLTNVLPINGSPAVAGNAIQAAAAGGTTGAAIQAR